MTSDASSQNPNDFQDFQSDTKDGKQEFVPDELLGAAAAYDETLRGSSEESESCFRFEVNNPEIARTLRLLRDVLEQQSVAAAGQSLPTRDSKKSLRRETRSASTCGSSLVTRCPARCALA